MKKIPVSVLKLLNVVFVLIPFEFVWFGYYEPITMTATSRQVSVLVMLAYICMFFFLARNLDGFRWGIRRIGELIFSQVIAAGVADVGAAILIWMLSIHIPNLVPGLKCYRVHCVVIAVYCFAGFKVFFATHPPRKAVIVYDTRQGMEELISSSGLDIRYNVQASYAIEELVRPDADRVEVERTMAEKLGDAEDVFMCGIHTHERNIILKYCIFYNKRVFMIPRMGDMLMSSATRMHMFYLPFLRVRRYDPSKTYLIIKRLFDIVVSGLALIITSPVMLVVSLMVRSDGGPAFYKQVRLTKDGKQFKIIKFRSMRVDAEKYTGAVWSAGENDPRITKVGKIIRACRLDELPQLWNIFVGDMSIVGPRPERPELAAEFEKEMPEFALRLQCKAGLTGYAQVYGKYNTTPYDKTLMDLMYIAHPSILEDLVIMLATVKILFSKESTEGVGERQENTLVYVENRRQEKDNMKPEQKGNENE